MTAQTSVFVAIRNARRRLSRTPGTDGDGSQITASNKLDESNKYTVKLQGTLAPVTGDQFMATLNSVTTQSTTVGTAASKTAILPNPNLGGFTSSNPPAALPKTPTEEKFGARMYVPSPYGQAFVTSQTLDVYQQTLLQTNTVFGFVRIPDPQIPRDLNIVSFRINSQYLRPGVLDGVIGYVYNPATLPTRRADLHDVDRRDGGCSTTRTSRQARSGTTPATCASSRPTSSSGRSISRHSTRWRCTSHSTTTQRLADRLAA